MEHEASQVLGKMFATLQTEGMTKGDIAKKLCISRADLESLAFGMDLADGDRAGERAGTSRANLKLV